MHCRNGSSGSTAGAVISNKPTLSLFPVCRRRKKRWISSSRRRTPRRSSSGGLRESANEVRVRQNLARARFSRRELQTAERKRRRLATFPPRSESGYSREPATGVNIEVQTGRGVAQERNSRSSMSVPSRSITVTLLFTDYCVLRATMMRSFEIPGWNGLPL
jgi:hypothetical protein